MTMGENGGTDITYKIGEVSRLTGVKAGTIRFYESCGFIGPVERAANRYRIYRERQVFQVRVCRLVFGGYVNKRLRRESLKVLSASAQWNPAAYGRECANYRRAVEEEIARTKKAIAFCRGQLLSREEIERTKKEIAFCRGQLEREEEQAACYSKKQAAVLTGATPEAIRNWERNGLLGQYEPYRRRLYGQEVLNRMYVIRLLLDIGYSMMAVKAYLQAYDREGPEEAERLLVSPGEDGDLLYRSDRYLEELQRLEEKTVCLERMKAEMERL